MNMNRVMSRIFGAAFLVSVGLTSCDSDDEEVVVPLEASLATNIPADPTQNADGTPRTKTGKFTLFRLSDGAVVPNADSATTKWDLGFRSTTIIVNSGVSGPGNTKAQIVEGIFDEIVTAPSEGYLADEENSLALPGSSWYSYTGQTGTPANAIIPIPGRVIVVKTSDGRYAKLEILSYYYGNPSTASEQFANTETRSPSRYFTFRYLYQPDGTTLFKE
jgi:hypothetical protein